MTRLRPGRGDRVSAWCCLSEGYLGREPRCLWETTLSHSPSLEAILAGIVTRQSEDVVDLVKFASVSLKYWELSGTCEPSEAKLLWDIFSLVKGRQGCAVPTSATPFSWLSLATCHFCGTDSTAGGTCSLVRRQLSTSCWPREVQSNVMFSHRPLDPFIHSQVSF